MISHHNATMLLLFLILLVLLNPSDALTCYQGTRVGPQSTCTANLSNNEQCITAQLLTPGLNTTNATEIYACGNCSYFQSATSFFANVSCCSSSDLCQVFGSILPASGTCESLNTEGGCTARTDCYWCQSVQAGTGLCKSLNGSSLPCFATSLLMPPAICSNIGCTPTSQPYNVSQLTLSFLNNFGFGKIAYPTDVYTALDLMSRQVRPLWDNVTYDFCDLDREFVEWCGINSSNYPAYFKYCLISETWPQPDLYGWLRNTTFTGATSFNPLYPAVCACLNPGRAYYIPTGFLITQNYYSPPCRSEHAMLAFYILLMLVTTGLLLYVIYETIFLAIHLWQQNTKKRINTIKLLIIKIVLVIYYLLAVPCQAIWVAPQYNGVTTSVVGLLRLLGIIFFEFALTFTIFTLCGLLLESELFGKNDRFFMWFFNIFKWVLLVWHSICFIALFAFAGATTFYYEAFTSTSIPNLTVFQQYATNAVGLAKTIFSLLPALLAIMEICGAFILAYTAYKIRDLFKSSEDLTPKVKAILYRVIFLAITFLILLIWLVFMSLYIYMENYVFARTIPSPFPTQYQGHYALQWFIWGMYVVELTVLVLVDMAMRAKVRSAWLFSLIMRQFSLSSGPTSTTTLSSSQVSGITATNTNAVDMNTEL